MHVGIAPLQSYYIPCLLKYRSFAKLLYHVYIANIPGVKAYFIYKREYSGSRRPSLVLGIMNKAFSELEAEEKAEEKKKEEKVKEGNIDGNTNGTTNKGGTVITKGVKEEKARVKTKVSGDTGEGLGIQNVAFKEEV